MTGKASPAETALDTLILCQLTLEATAKIVENCSAAEIKAQLREARSVANKAYSAAQALQDCGSTT